MARTGEAQRGSQKWLQLLANDNCCQEIFFKQLAPKLKLLNKDQIKWCSPYKADNYREYSDEAFLVSLGIKLSKMQLSEFWPKGGPVWDGLAKTDCGDILLIEAKTHIDELLSNPSAAKKTLSQNNIRKRLDETKDYFNSNSKIEWGKLFYQYTNRLAHLYFLRELNDMDNAYLIFVYFINDKDMEGPETQDEWKGAIKLMERVLGLRKHKLKPYVLDIFIDVNELNK